ncbi:MULTISPECIES: ATP-dependent RNA helicase HrpA [Streptomyces]|uniref:ATP-dependent RNA helicase HrpA n=1 Tax=Streptomyces sudanensis TaxID=436397 RepID=A0ABY4TCT5_9ACTN|nr:MULTISPECIES: ATP-dependent RNA helicase HrpA [Streptomyces]MCP9958311.1 ATP-dependent RNA helicase HrpA [Streptomyces sudanensis]MCQ0001172.1 ATP-dependent RNA helicase HrpA [Streptomyces sudanensis]URN16759.1 ATP-dependent RNA helicase HrpA [Streptomyces sudanensis]
MSTSFADLQGLLAEVPLRDAHRLGRRLEGARRIHKPEARQAVLDEIAAEAAKAAARTAERASRVPEVTYPEQLPVSRKKDEILEAIRDHQVVIVAGETGSGKTTQIPKICLELGRGVRGMIGHTQPRRLAARTVAERVAEELRTPLGEAVGWKVRFTDQVGSGTFVKLMTDGILLAEIQTDRELRAYDTIIIDEAHERSLNIDFLLGYLAQLLPRRPDLKVVITSATIDPERFSRHFGDAPIVEVSGRTYPVEVRYRPLLEEDSEEPDRDQITAICDAVDELQAEGPGDILVFLSGEREIRDTADALLKRKLRNTEVLPLYARLSHAEQHRVFQQHAGRRVVLATNVAETSLTVPGIKYVVDPGTARISRYSHRTKVQRLPIEPISQASANQRKGRCGRTSDGICIRLYSEEDFLARPEFTDAEILRTNLASVILQMTAAGLGDIEKFPFIDPPDHRNIRDGVQLLQELGALDPAQKDPKKRLTPLGRKLAQLPVDPRLARMVLEADRNGCVREVMVIAAALSIQDPRERPAEKQAQADQQHARFKDETSDFLAFLNLWRYVREQQKALSSSAFRRMCKSEYLNYLRIREWQDIYSQLRTVAKQMGMHVNEEDADERRVHVSLLAGLLSHIGVKDVKEGAKNEYLGARNAKFAIFPGSALFRKPPRFVMSAELVETSRLWARVNARIEPEWIEPLAGHLLKRTYSEPHWEKDQAAVMAYEKVTLYGVPIVAQRKVNYGRIDPEVSRDLFIRNALVEGDWRTHHKFFADNRRLLTEVEELEHRARRRDILVDDETLFDFYDRRIPAHVVSGAHFDSWWKHKRRDEPELLDFEREMLINEKAGAVTKADYPDTWRQGRLAFRVTYQFEPGADADGVTVHVPLQVLNQVTGEGFDWQIPGLREEVVTELIRSLPKPIRRNYVPAPNFAKRFLAAAAPGAEPLTSVLARELKRMVGVPVSPDDFDWTKVPDHLKITFRIVDERRRKLAEDKDLEALRLRLRPKTRQALSKAAAAATAGPSGPGSGSLERSGLTDWTIGTLTRVFETRRAGQPVKAYPALVDQGETVAVRLFDTEAEQTRAMWRGTRRLVMLNIPVNPAKFASDKLTNQQKLALSRNPHGSVQALFEDCATAAADRLIADHGGPAWDEEAYRKLYDGVRADLVDLTVRTVDQVQQILAAWQSCERRLKTVTSPVLVNNVQDVREQLAALVPPGFVTATGLRRLPDLMRYLVAVDRRLQQMPTSAQRDTARMERVHEMQDEYAWLLEQFPEGRPVPQEVLDVRWMIEELRVSYFAHALGTAYPVSDKRIVKAIDALAP